MEFKFFSGKEGELLNFTNNHIILTPYRFNPENVEFCFQFGDGDPVVFASGPNECTISLNPTNNTNMIFNDGNGNVFKLFAREIQND